MEGGFLYTAVFNMLNSRAPRQFHSVLRTLSKRHIFSSAMLLVFSIILILFKDIPDIDGDEMHGIKSLASQIGPELRVYSEVIGQRVNMRENTFEFSLHREMDIFAFIHTLDPTKVKVVEREQNEDEPQLLDTTVGRNVQLLPVAPDHAESELEASVERLFDEGVVGALPRIMLLRCVATRLCSETLERKSMVVDAGGASHPPKKLREDHGTPSGAFVGGGVRSNTGVFLDLTGSDAFFWFMSWRYLLPDSERSYTQDFVENDLYFGRKFYPHLLTTISGRMWLLTHGMELAIVKCLNSPKYVSALGTAIGKSIKKEMQDGLAVGITHGKEGRVLTDVAAHNPFAEVDYISTLQQLQNVNFPLLVELRSKKDASVKTMMDTLRLEGPIAEKLGLNELQPNVDQLMVRKIRENIANQRSVLRDVFVPLAEPFSYAVLTGAEGTSDTVPSAVNTTTALSTTLTSASLIAPISVNDYEVVGTDD
ncbi:hypothetical protein Tco_0801568 [Tanacetum coccineum]|uniref:Transmembrane protein n=1 Tax=Tanacetum coccineum TaxID=301880 RepID=A0ABQ5A0C3_9ASTR